MSSSELHWTRYRVILLTLTVFFLHPIESNDFEEIYKLARSKCYKNPKNYLGSKTNLTKCNVSFAGACWPEVTAGSTFIQPCPTMFFLPGGFIHRRCNTRGHWERMNISQCRKLEASQGFKNMKDLPCDTMNTTCSQSNRTSTVELKQQYINEGHVFMTFSWISVSIMLPSLLVLLACRKDTNQKDRFSLHINVLMAFLMRNLTYFIDYYANLTLSDSLRMQRVCTGVWILNRYFAAAEVTWMTNEAIFLLRLLIRAFDNESYFWRYFCFGWGLPAFLAFTVYIPVTLVVYGTNDLRCWGAHGQEPIMMILYGPMTCMLLINLGITIFALYTLVRKMQETSTQELQIARKTTKGALILFPQMGVIYLAIFYTPEGNTTFDYFVRVVFPLQGAFAALVFVACNSEVRQTVKHRWYQWCHRNDVMQKSTPTSSVDEHCRRRFSARLNFPDCLKWGVLLSPRSSSPTPATRTTSLNPDEILDMPFSLESVAQSPTTPCSEIIEMREIRHQPLQKNISKASYYPQPGCSHAVPVVIPRSSTATPSCETPPSYTKHKPLQATTGPRRDRVSTGSFRGTRDLEAYTRYHPIQAQLQPMMQESTDSGIEELHGEKRLSIVSIEDENFEEVIHLEQSQPARHTPSRKSRSLYAKRMSCPAVCNPSTRLKYTLPLNVREAFKGYGVCDDTKELKKPRRPARSSSLFKFRDLGSEIHHHSAHRIAWAEEEKEEEKKIGSKKGTKS